MVALDAKPGEHVLDLCCAPGAKLCAIADGMQLQGTVTGVDVSEERLAACRTLCLKYGIQCARLVASDGRSFCLPPPSRHAAAPSEGGRTFDAVRGGEAGAPVSKTEPLAVDVVAKAIGEESLVDGGDALAHCSEPDQKCSNQAAAPQSDPAAYIGVDADAVPAGGADASGAADATGSKPESASATSSATMRHRSEGPRQRKRRRGVDDSSPFFCGRELSSNTDDHPVQSSGWSSNRGGGVSASGSSWSEVGGSGLGLEAQVSSEARSAEGANMIRDGCDKCGRDGCGKGWM